MERSLADQFAEDIVDLGAAFYFAPGTLEVAEELGLNGVEFYGLGRAGVLLDPSIDNVVDTFYFFPRRAIEFAMANSESHNLHEIAEAYARCADRYAELRMSGISEDDLRMVGDASDMLAQVVAPGRSPIYDGYRRLTRPTSEPARAFRSVVELRELRGGLHAGAVKDVGLAGNEATYVHDRGLFELHGFNDSDVPTGDLDELAARRDAAEVATSQAMEAYLDQLPRGLLANLVQGVHEMRSTRGLDT